MQLGLAIAVALLIVAVVAWPLVTRRRNASATSEPAESASDVAHAAALDTVYDAIRTLQTDYRLGRVNDDDYREQLDEYRRQAATLLRDMERETGSERDG